MAERLNDEGFFPPPLTEAQIGEVILAAESLDRCLRSCALHVALALEQRAGKAARELREWARKD